MSVQDPDYVLSIDGLDEQADGGATAAKRRWIGVRFDCCGVYQRLYKSRDGRSYRGRCPQCFRPVRIRVGPGGTNARFFIAE